MILFTLLFTLFSARAESGPGNGTDYVKVLFAEAQYELNRSMISLNSPQGLPLDHEVRAWLEAKNRFLELKNYVRKMELRFQQAPCSDVSRIPASICYFTDEPSNPYVVISVSENKMTTKDQAIAMLLHEAGHFTGEMDHLFLDRMGLQLGRALKTPRLLIADASSSEVVANIFAAKEECNRGTSQQARTLAQKVRSDLIIQCASRGVSCDIEKAQLVFQGTTHFDRGEAFDMKVLCTARGVLDLTI